MNEIISIDHSIELRGFILICELERMYGKKFDMIETNKIKLFSDEFFPCIDESIYRYKIEDFLEDEYSFIEDKIYEVLKKYKLSPTQYEKVYHPYPVK
tara:strand:+ start:174 stop:467 length:294 start_codon:yes stop_codon:yes gene_type:complete